MERDEIVRRYTSTKTLLVDYMERPGSLEDCHYRAPLDSWSKWIAAAVHLDKTFRQKLLIPKTGGYRSLAGTFCYKQGTTTLNVAGVGSRSNLLFSTRRSATIFWVASVSQKYMF